METLNNTTNMQQITNGKMAELNESKTGECQQSKPEVKRKLKELDLQRIPTII